MKDQFKPRSEIRIPVLGRGTVYGDQLFGGDQVIVF